MHLIALPIAHNEHVISLLEAALSRARSGQTQAVAIVEANRDGSVTIECNSGSACYHQLNSGAARLAAFLANQHGE